MSFIIYPRAFNEKLKTKIIEILVTYAKEWFVCENSFRRNQLNYDL